MVDTHTITVGIGFPQGGVCSAKFWIIAFNQAIEMINNYGVTGQGFTDDCGPMTGGDNTHEMYKSMQRMLNKLYHWGEGKNLKFSPTKTVAVLFSKKHKPKQKFLKLGGKFIKHETQVKYLGVTLDRRLSWRDHINDKISTCKAMLLNITNKYRHTHKAKPILMKWIYTGVIRPKLTYACVIWGNKINTKLIQQKLNGLNRLACLLTTNLTRTTPQMSLEIILNIEPLDIHIKKIGLTAYKRQQIRQCHVVHRPKQISPPVLGPGPTHCYN